MWNKAYISYTSVNINETKMITIGCCSCKLILLANAMAMNNIEKLSIVGIFKTGKKDESCFHIFKLSKCVLKPHGNDMQCHCQ